MMDQPLLSLDPSASQQHHDRKHVQTNDSGPPELKTASSNDSLSGSGDGGDTYAVLPAPALLSDEYLLLPPTSMAVTSHVPPPPQSPPQQPAAAAPSPPLSSAATSAGAASAFGTIPSPLLAPASKSPAAVNSLPPPALTPSGSGTVRPPGIARTQTRSHTATSLGRPPSAGTRPVQHSVALSTLPAAAGSSSGGGVHSRTVSTVTGSLISADHYRSVTNHNLSAAHAASVSVSAASPPHGSLRVPQSGGGGASGGGGGNGFSIAPAGVESVVNSLLHPFERIVVSGCGRYYYALCVLSVVLLAFSGLTLIITGFTLRDKDELTGEPIRLFSPGPYCDFVLTMIVLLCTLYGADYFRPRTAADRERLRSRTSLASVNDWEHFKRQFVRLSGNRLAASRTERVRFTRWLSRLFYVLGVVFLIRIGLFITEVTDRTGTIGAAAHAANRGSYVIAGTFIVHMLQQATILFLVVVHSTHCMLLGQSVRAIKVLARSQLSPALSRVFEYQRMLVAHNSWWGRSAGLTVFWCGANMFLLSVTGTTPSSAVQFVFWAKVVLNVCVYIPLLVLLPSFVTAETEALILSVNSQSATLFQTPSAAVLPGTSGDTAATTAALPPANASTGGGVSIDISSKDGIALSRSIIIFCDRVRHLDLSACVGHVAMSLDFTAKVLFILLISGLYLFVSTATPGA